MARELVDGHYKGSNKAKVAAVYKSKGKAAALRRASELGLSDATARNYVSEFGGGPVARSRSAAKKAVSKKSAPVKKASAKKVAKKAPKKSKVADLQG